MWCYVVIFPDAFHYIASLAEVKYILRQRLKELFVVVYPCLIRVLKSQHSLVGDFCWRELSFFVGDHHFNNISLDSPLWGNVFPRRSSRNGSDTLDFSVLAFLILLLVLASPVVEGYLPLGGYSISHFSPLTYFVSRPFLISASITPFTWM